MLPKEPNIIIEKAPPRLAVHNIIADGEMQARTISEENGTEAIELVKMLLIGG